MSSKAERDFAQFLVDRTPEYDKEMVKDIAPSDTWISHVICGDFYGKKKKFIVPLLDSFETAIEIGRNYTDALIKVRSLSEKSSSLKPLLK